MKLERLTLLRPNMGDYRSLDAMPPLAMAILAARTPAGVAVTFYDDRIEAVPEDDCPDLVALSVETFTARRAYELARRYRERGVTVVMGGYHPTLLPDEALEHADAVVVGDAEGSWERLLEDFRQGRLQRTYRQATPPPLDSVVMDRTIFAGKRYAPVEPVQFSRGCRFVCDFCSVKSFYGNGVRFRPVADMVNELKGLERGKFLFFVDDNLFGSRTVLLELLDAITPLGLRWSCQISIDVARDEILLDHMAQAGCIFVLIGFETLSTENLRQMGKPWNRVAGEYQSVVQRLHRRGMAVYGTFVFGYDQDDVAAIEATARFARQAGLDIANFNPLTPTPGSPLYERLHAEGRLLLEKWWLDPEFRYGQAIFRPRAIEPEAFATSCFAAKKAFYTWPAIARRILANLRRGNLFRITMVALVNVISRREVLRKQYRQLGG